jgi:hypothetical protein
MSADPNCPLFFPSTFSALPFSLSDFKQLSPSPEPPQIKVLPLEPLDAQGKKHGARVLHITGLLSHIECTYLIDKLKGDGPVEVLRSQLQARERTVFDTSEFADLLYERLGAAVATLPGLDLDERGRPTRCDDSSTSDVSPENMWVGDAWARKMKGRWRPAGMNARLQFCSYQPKGFFRAHCDGQVFKDEDDTMSLYTCILCLDDKYKGGGIRFLQPDLKVEDVYEGAIGAEKVLAEIQPETGSCLLFYQIGALNEVVAIGEGEKHVLQSEIMFKREIGTGDEQTNDQKEAMCFLAQAQEAEEGRNFEAAMHFYKKAFRLDPDLEGQV